MPNPAANVEEKVRFEENDLFKADIAKASVVTLYLLPDVNQRLRPKLLKELKPLWERLPRNEGPAFLHVVLAAVGEDRSLGALRGHTDRLRRS